MPSRLFFFFILVLMKYVSRVQHWNENVIEYLNAGDFVASFTLMVESFPYSILKLTNLSKKNDCVDLSQFQWKERLNSTRHVSAFTHPVLFLRQSSSIFQDKGKKAFHTCPYTIIKHCAFPSILGEEKVNAICWLALYFKKTLKIIATSIKPVAWIIWACLGRMQIMAQDYLCCTL